MEINPNNNTNSHEEEVCDTRLGFIERLCGLLQKLFSHSFCFNNRNIDDRVWDAMRAEITQELLDRLDKEDQEESFLQYHHHHHHEEVEVELEVEDYDHLSLSTLELGLTTIQSRSRSQSQSQSQTPSTSEVHLEEVRKQIDIQYQAEPRLLQCVAAGEDICLRDKLEEDNLFIPITTTTTTTSSSSSLSVVTATKREREVEEDNPTECKICLETSVMLKMLPCSQFHVACCDCIDRLLRENAAGNMFIGKAAFCPFCRSRFTAKQLLDQEEKPAVSHVVGEPNGLGNGGSIAPSSSNSISTPSNTMTTPRDGVSLNQSCKGCMVKGRSLVKLPCGHHTCLLCTKTLLEDNVARSGPWSEEFMKGSYCPQCLKKFTLYDVNRLMTPFQKLLVFFLF